jgi:radical SAM protein with 4Fe4S-binding SPASM domain
MPVISNPSIHSVGSSQNESGMENDERVETRSVSLRPVQVTWEMTRACEWKPASRRSAGRGPRHREMFSSAEAFHLIEEVANMHVPLLALTGGDPLQRGDLFPIIEFAAARSLRTSLTMLPTPLLDAAVVPDLKASGLMRAGFWLHGSTPALHDSYWGVPGSYQKTLAMIGACLEVQLPVQINTTLARRNFHDMHPIIELLTRLDIDVWNVVFFVPSSREKAAEGLGAAEHEQAFAKLYTASRQTRLQIKTTEGPHYQRYLLQQSAHGRRGRIPVADVVARAPHGGNDGMGAVFVDHAGEVFPGRFLPLSAGNVTRQRLSDLYRESALFVSLRDRSRLKGKCRRCPARALCGGSRARAWAMTGDLFAAEPCCAYEP